VRLLVVASLLATLLGCTSATQTKKSTCGATVSVAPQQAANWTLGRSAVGESAGTFTVGVCRE